MSHGPSRRELLGSLGAAAGGMLLLNDGVAQEKNPAAQVADSAAGLRITAMKTHLVQHKVYVEIQTSAKVTGWGEVSALVPAAAEALARSLFELLDGENPTRIEHLWQKLYRAHRDMRGGPFMVHTIAGIDMALWDITGKAWGVPVYRLLGGPTPHHRFDVQPARQVAQGDAAHPLAKADRQPCGCRPRRSAIRTSSSSTTTTSSTPTSL